MATASICPASFGQEEINYTKMQMIIQKVCHKVLVEYLLKYIKDKHPGDSVDVFLSNNENTVNGGRDSYLYEKRYFPKDTNKQPVSTNVHKWDIQMLYFVLTRCCNLKHLEMDLTFIKDKRNYLCHLGEPKVPDGKFTSFKQDIDPILGRSFKCFGDKFEKEITEDMAIIDSHLTEQLIDAYQALHREHFVAEQIKCLCEEYKRTSAKHTDYFMQLVCGQTKIHDLFFAFAKTTLAPPDDSMRTASLDSFPHTDTAFHEASTGKRKTGTSNVDPCALITNEHADESKKQIVEEVQQTFGGMAESMETRRENWLRVVSGLLYVKEGLQEYVDTKGKQQYTSFMNKVNEICNNQTCDQCQFNSRCASGMTKVKRSSRFRPGHFCDEMNKAILNNHVRHYPFWMNTDSTKWHDQNVGYWEVAKCYLSSPGYLDRMGPNQVDVSGLLSICINSSFINQHIKSVQLFEEVQCIRNKTLHEAFFELDGQTADDYLDKMITLLEDPKELIHNTFAKQAAVHLTQLYINS
ncbi:uncharacterized protein LOC128222090 isoform X2 [Mya arenaria]|uniref:uncharacterized protein LOC128222090 isoform X2 n=1 Tax=Mya arenaria TaxID=6604 RepID=UPI0022DF5A20|nr:uncharacterized protein LOC128222090 isoform X2 [Mya arenaria]